MSGNRDHGRRRRGEALAHELVQFIRRETPDREEAAEVLLGAFDRFERETRLIRGVSPWPPEAGDVKPDLNTPQ